MIDILTTQKLTVRRFCQGNWVDGYFVKGKVKEFDIPASVQAMSPNERMLLPEHVRTKEMIKIYTSDNRLTTTKEKGQKHADIVIHDDKKFEVFSVNNWHIGTDLPHYEIIAKKIDGEG